MAMAIQPNFHFKAILDLFGRLAMQPKETTMALLHNSQTWLSSVHQPLFFQLTLFSFFTLQYFQELRAYEGCEAIQFSYVASPGLQMHMCNV